MSKVEETEEQAWGRALKYLGKLMAEHHRDDLTMLVRMLQQARDCTWRESRERLAEMWTSEEEGEPFDKSNKKNWCGRAVVMTQEEIDGED
jgi:hypothetical protein